MSVSRETAPEGLKAEGFARSTDVSRETLERLSAYVALLQKWQGRINLVGPATLPDVWRRHMLDSAQLLPFLPAGPVVDLGSGAGFPGLVLAVLRPEGAPVHLVEADTRKCAFLREVVRVTGAAAVVHPCRIEALPPFPAAAVTARALAPLRQLLIWAEPFLAVDSHCLFLKGRGAEEELTEASKDWMMAVERIPSQSDPTGIILHLREVHRGRDEHQPRPRNVSP